MKRRYFFITLPYVDIAIAESIRVGRSNTTNCSLDGSVMFIATNEAKIAYKISTGVSFQDIFPPAQTVESTLEEAQIRLGSIEFTEAEE